METRPRLVGIDYGKKRVGVAVADPLRLFAQPYGTYPPRDAIEVLQELHRTQGIERLIIGWPLLEDGQEGETTRRVEAYAERIGKALPGIDVVRVDERYSSERAVEAIRSSGAGRKARQNKARIDAAAAALILQDYLDTEEG